jgi:hypothetical protein
VIALGAGVAAAVAPLAAGILWMLRRLWRARDPRTEQVAIGLGAKLGNGLLACTLAWLILDAQGATDGMRAVVVAFVALGYGSAVLSLASRPDDIEIAYKG